jgi:hypothetical protein
MPELQSEEEIRRVVREAYQPSQDAVMTMVDDYLRDDEQQEYFSSDFICPAMSG